MSLYGMLNETGRRHSVPVLPSMAPSAPPDTRPRRISFSLFFARSSLSSSTHRRPSYNLDSVVDCLSSPGAPRRHRRPSYNLDSVVDCLSPHGPPRKARRPSYNLDSVVDCLPPDPDPASYVPEPLDRLPLKIHAVAQYEQEDPLTHWDVAYEQEIILAQDKIPTWTQVRTQFNRARDRSDFDHAHPHTIHQRHAFLSLWTLHVLADRLSVCI